ncbi:MAG: hypothetical protein WAW85_07380 [Gordonia sp. (in: high G+C Gram-positive bacteria)]|uniref:hypothetical protein n=1 Tax=Gordonia sp. (in: high G+C Gram-positive bacteria) TaxID=84139 RepID=UPI003BB7C657
MKKRPGMIVAAVACVSVVGMGVATAPAQAEMLGVSSLSSGLSSGSTSNGSLAIDMFGSVLGTVVEVLLTNGS